jgi:DNA-directed RNA polymerase specialized sigma24 family protein
MQRACFELVALRDIPIEQAAAMHGISESTVRQHVFRARRALGNALGGYVRE